MPKQPKHEERCRILSVYLRPWVLHRSYASAHVPHLFDLHQKVSSVLRSFPAAGKIEKRVCLKISLLKEVMKSPGTTTEQLMWFRNTLRGRFAISCPRKWPSRAKQTKTTTTNQDKNEL